jgi:tetratricopeptide (TPR) repeat protein
MIIINISHIQRAIKAGDFKKANELVDKYLAQGNICLPSEYYQLYEIFETLGRFEEAKKYLNLTMESDITGKINDLL